MKDEGEHRPIILVIAPWFDFGNFRARITSTDPHAPSGTSSTVVTSKARTLHLVEEWLATVEPNGEPSG